MKYVKIVISMIVFSNAAFSMVEVVGSEKENSFPFAFSNAPFSMGSSGECSKPAVRRKQQKQRVITNYYPKVAKGTVSQDEVSFDARVKRPRVTSEPLSEIDTNAQAVTDFDSEGMLVTGSCAGRVRSRALNEDDLYLIAMLTSLEINK